MKEVKLYQPSNGIEGECFINEWCGHCAKDKSMSEGKDYDECNDDEICKIIAATMAYDIDDSEYPKEWIYNEYGHPCCTAFVQAGTPIPLKDDLTLDLF